MYSVHNSFRVAAPTSNLNGVLRVKYVVILGYQYSSYNLVSMRIHDINVVADLTRHDPTVQTPDEPVAYDGTVDGCYAEVEPSSAVQFLLGDIQDLNADLCSSIY